MIAFPSLSMLCTDELRFRSTYTSINTPFATRRSRVLISLSSPTPAINHGEQRIQIS